jgi:hypothetical protein
MEVNSMPSLLKQSVLCRALGIALLCTSLISADVLIDDFEGVGAPSGWIFSNGPEFPGATGSLAAGQGRAGSGACARLMFDMSGGGNYVSASRSLSPTIKNQSGLSLWARVPTGVNIVCRITDSTNQTLQYPVSRPLCARDSASWFVVTIRFSDQPSVFWGGANDGAVHGGVKGISVLAEPYKEGASAYFLPAGSILFDDVTLIDAIAVTIDPASNAQPIADIGSLAGKLGANIHFTRDDRALDSLATAGFTWVRMDMAWSGIEYVKNSYDFTNFDTLVATLTRRNMKAHFILDYSNTLYPGVTAWNVGPKDPAAVQGFAAYCKASAQHFAGKAESFEVWNEPNLAGFWQPQPDTVAYATLCKAAIAAVHQGNPNAKVSTGGLSGMDQQFMRGTLVLDGGAGTDAFGVHPYRKGAPESMAEDLDMMRLIVKRYFPTATPPVWQTEWGYSSGWYGSGAADSTRLVQATLVVREFLSSWIAGFPFMIYYDVRDDGTDPLDAEHNFGLLTNDYRNKPAMTAVKTLMAGMQGRQLAGYLAVRSNALTALKFTGGSEILLALWASKGRGWTGYDTPKEIVSVPVVFAQRPASMVDHLGNSINVPVEVNGTWPMTIGNSAVYVTFPPTAARVAARTSDAPATVARKSVALSPKAGRLPIAGEADRFTANGGRIAARAASSAAGIVVEKGK